MTMRQPKLSERTHKVLLGCVSLHIRSGRPIGSRILEQYLDFSWSSATLRKELAQLCERGFLLQPHTSSGRIPTWRGYRYFVDCLSQGPSQHIEHPSYLKRLVPIMNELDSLRKISRLLAEFSHQAGIAISLPENDAKLQRVEFVHVHQRCILAILVTHTEKVYHRQVRLQDPIRKEDVLELNGFLQSRWQGLSLTQVRSRLITELERRRTHADQALTEALRSYGTFLEEIANPAPIIIEGQNALLQGSAFEDLTEITPVLAAFDRHDAWVRLLDSTLTAGKIEVHIGAENPIAGLEKCTLITAPFRGPNQERGQIGLIGPMRMDYRTMIGLVDLTANVVSRRLDYTRAT